jgi:hypothetical protein
MCRTDSHADVVCMLCLCVVCPHGVRQLYTPGKTNSEQSSRGRYCAILK